MVSKKIILWSFLGITLLKFFLLPWSAHPFDFWSFVNTVERSIFFNWGLFEYWNKGNFLVLMWNSLYLVYLQISDSFLFFSENNILLLHFLFKLPFLFIDIISCYLIFRIVEKVSSKKTALFAASAWFFNPLVFYVYGIHGHYDILIPFSLLLIIFGLQNRNFLLFAIGTVICFSIKYFAIIFFPFIFLFFIYKRLYKEIFFSLLLFLLGIFVVFFHFFLDQSYFFQTIDSIISLSSSEGAPSNEVSLKKETIFLNIFSAIYFISGESSHLIETSLLKMQSIQLIILIPIFIIFHFLLRLFFLKKGCEYEIEDLLTDMFLVLSYFCLTLFSFQYHYFIWFVPLWILLIFYNKYNSLWIPFLLFTIFGFILSFKNELGPSTFFLDILENSFSSLSSKSVEILMILSFGILLSIVVAIFLLLRNNFLYTNNKFFKNTTFPFFGVLWVIIIVIYSIAINFYFSKDLAKKDLYYASKANFHKGVISGIYPVDSSFEDVFYFSDKALNKSLIFKELSNLSIEEKGSFNAFLFFKDDALLKNVSLINDPIYINDCLVEKTVKNQRIIGFRGDPKVLQFDISCLNVKQNKISWKNLDYISKNDIYLYIVNKPSEDVSISKRLAIIFLTFGWVFLISISFASSYIFYKLKKQLNE